MKYLTLAYIKAHSRIEYDIEDSLLEMYGDSAETIVMDMCNTSYNKMVAEYNGIPKPILHATLMLVDWSYQQRSPVNQYNLWAVPYTFDMLIKPYIKLVDDSSGDEPEVTESIVLDVPFSEGISGIALDWSEYAFTDVKEALDEGKNVTVRCIRDNSAENTYYLYPNGVQNNETVIFTGWFSGLLKVTAILRQDEETEPGVGDISCEITTSLVATVK